MFGVGLRAITAFRILSCIACLIICGTVTAQPAAATWQKIDLVAQGITLKQFSVFGPNHIWVLDTKRQIHLSSDAGASWTKVHTFEQFEPDTITLLNAQTGIVSGVAVVDRTRVFAVMKTTDAGRTFKRTLGLQISPVLQFGKVEPQASAAKSWDAAASVQDVYLAAPDFTSSFLLLKSGNAGESFRDSKHTKLITEIARIKFIDQKNGLIVGGVLSDATNRQIPYGVILRTQDGGETWQQVYRSVMPASVASHLAITQDGTVIALEQAYVEAVSQPVLSPKTQELVSVARRSVAGVLLKSADQGATWGNTQLINPPPGTINITAYTDMVFASPNIGWVVSTPNAYMTVDAGRTWQRSNPEPSILQMQAQLGSSGDLTVYALGQNLHRMHTSVPGMGK